jgi:hypothetical protein
MITRKTWGGQESGRLLTLADNSTMIESISHEARFFSKALIPNYLDILDGSILFELDMAIYRPEVLAKAETSALKIYDKLFEQELIDFPKQLTSKSNGDDYLQRLFHEPSDFYQLLGYNITDVTHTYRGKPFSFCSTTFTNSGAYGERIERSFCNLMRLDFEAQALASFYLNYRHHPNYSQYSTLVKFALTMEPDSQTVVDLGENDAD